MKLRTIALLTLVVILIGLPLYLLLGTNTKYRSDISYYRALSGETDGRNAVRIFGPYGDNYCPYDLPMLSELGDYEDVRFSYKAKRMSVFQYHAYTLIVEYDENTYAEQRSALEERYTYCTASSQGFDSGDMTEYEHTMDGFEIHAIEGGYYPKEMMYIGYSDDRNEIAIIYYYNQDLDFVDDPMGKFIVENTGWRKVVK